jgi:hypothetical protein
LGRFAGYAFELNAYCLPRESVSQSVYLPFVVRNYSAGMTTTAESLGLVPVQPGVSRAPLAACQDKLEPCEVHFEKPLTLTIHYTDTILTPGLDESTLKLYYWDKGQNKWVDAGTTCPPADRFFDLDTTDNWLKVHICHLSQFSIGGR